MRRSRPGSARMDLSRSSVCSTRSMFAIPRLRPASCAPCRRTRRPIVNAKELTRVQIFAFEPSEFRQTFERQGWVHIPGGITPEFLDIVRRFIAESFDDTRIASRAIPGKKEQSLFEFPAGMDYEPELFDAISALTGLERATMTLSERHINGYDAQANPNPVPHKDRYASQISVGLSIQIPAESQLVVYPFDHLELNPFNTAAEFYDSLPEEQKPEIVMRSAPSVVIDDQPGDVVAFYGNKTWHLRRNSANSFNLYL